MQLHSLSDSDVLRLYEHEHLRNKRTLADISSSLGFTPRYLDTRLRKLGLSAVRHFLTDDEILTLYNTQYLQESKTLKAISKSLGLRPFYFADQCRRLNLPTKRVLTDDEVRQIYQDLHVGQGISYREICKNRNLNLEYFGKRCRTLGLSPVAGITDERIITLYQQEHLQNNLPLVKISESLGLHSTYMSIRLKKLNLKPIKLTTFAERELLEYISSLGIENVIQHDRQLIKPFELDIYLPDYKLAIEYCGHFWHSAKYKHKNYHLGKLLVCQNLGISLLTIFEQDWVLHQTAMKSLLQSKLGKTKRLYARECKTIELSSITFAEFLDSNHLQGHVPSSVKLGLLDKDNVLVAVMGFSPARFSKKYQWEMTRFASIHDTTVVGGASKLFKHFQRSHLPTSVVSYADRRYSEGKLYHQLGFTYSHDSSPNYWYFNKNESFLHNRLHFQKHKLKHLLGTFDSNLSESQNMRVAGWDKIYDCGNRVFVWGKPNE